MDYNKNKYLSESEFNTLINTLPNKQAIVCNLIYREGFRVLEALNKSGCKHRAMQKMLMNRCKKYALPLITMRDLRRAYLLNHPELLYHRIKRNRKPISVRDRWLCLSRDGFKCVACGRTSKEYMLHVDHIIPHSKGGKDSLDNYQTLCALCNMGKSDLNLMRNTSNISSCLY